MSAKALRRALPRVGGQRSRHEESGAMPRLVRRCGDGAAARDALVGGQAAAMLDEIDQQVEGALRMRLNELELREGVLEGLDVVAVLDLVEAVRRCAAIVILALACGGRPRRRDAACIGRGLGVM